MEGLEKAINKLSEKLAESNINSPWLNQQEAAAYLRMSIPTFLKGKFKSHNLFEKGIAVERWNRNELDQEMLKR